MKRKSFRQYQKELKEQYDRESEVRLQTTSQCKICGHKNVIPVQKDSCLCSWCHNKVINDTKAHFIYKTRKLLDQQKGQE